MTRASHPPPGGRLTPRQRRDGAGTVLGLAATATGLSAGLLFAYACSVLPGLARTGDRTFVEAMQQINEAIQNPVCFAAVRNQFEAPWIAWNLGRTAAAAAALGCLARALVLHGRGQRR